MIAKNTFKKIGHSFGRFMSLVMIILLGVGFYAGIRQSAPAIRDAENSFVRSQNMMDLHIVSTLGLTDDDIDELNKLSTVEMATGGYSKYVYADESVIRVMSMDEIIDRYELCEGTRPWRDNECLADKEHYKVGDIIIIREPGIETEEDIENERKAKEADKDKSSGKNSYDKKKDNKDETEDKDSDDEEPVLVEHKYYVTGTVISPIYMGKDYGKANIGNGELYSYILVKKDVFDMDVYSDVYVTMKKDEEDVPYSDSYQEKLEMLERQVKSITEEREQARVDELYQEALDTAYDKVEEKRPEVEAEVRAEIEKKVREELTAQQEAKTAELKEKAGKLGMTFESFISTLSDTVVNFLSPITDEAVDKLVDEQLDDAVETAMETAHAEAQEEIEIPECTWYVRNRNDEISNYKALSDQYAIVEGIADIIPIFFVVIVLLMTSNTMSRMIAEERGEMGTFTSLGYGNRRIIGGYMIYVLMATLIGVVGGYFIGVNLLPGFVFACFPLAMTSIRFMFDGKMFLACLIVAFAEMTLVTIFSCMKELVHKPAYLLRPVPPKGGRKLLIERVKGLWKLLSFSWKITIRNLARYRQRVLMTIIGVGGCTFLMLIGYAIRDCISEVGSVQFGDILHYEVMAVLDEKVKSFDDIDFDGTNPDRIFADPLMMRQEVLKTINSDGYSLDVYLLVPDEDSDLFTEYFSLQAADPRDVKVKKDGEVEKPEKGTPFTLSDDGVIITPRIAEIMNTAAGDELELTDEDGKKYSVKVEGITENYVANYVYMSEQLYRRVFRSGVMYNTVVANIGDGYSTDENTDRLTEKILDLDDFVSVSTRDYMLKKANDQVKGLDGIVILLIVIASMLAFTVLYNLTSISISERTREIATLKVLGFTYFETNDYIYRETIISSLIGIAAGLLVSPYLHGMVMDILGMDNLLFLRQIKRESFIMSAALALSFTLVMMLITFIKLTRINMIESLKSVD